MLSKPLKYYLVKINRITGWVLFALIIIFIFTGFASTGRYGFSKWMLPDKAVGIHQLLIWPVISIFVIHSMLNMYFSFKRWGWLK
ncbi:hypothetical protein ACFL54_01645 [Planctomycetota bacterium]